MSVKDEGAGDEDDAGNEEGVESKTSEVCGQLGLSSIAASKFMRREGGLSWPKKGEICLWLS